MAYLPASCQECKKKKQDLAKKWLEENLAEYEKAKKTAKAEGKRAKAPIYRALDELKAKYMEENPKKAPKVPKEPKAPKKPREKKALKEEPREMPKETLKEKPREAKIGLNLKDFEFGLQLINMKYPSPRELTYGSFLMSNLNAGNYIDILNQKLKEMKDALEYKEVQDRPDLVEKVNGIIGKINEYIAKLKDVPRLNEEFDKEQSQLFKKFKNKSEYWKDVDEFKFIDTAQLKELQKGCDIRADGDNIPPKHRATYVDCILTNIVYALSNYIATGNSDMLTYAEKANEFLLKSNSLKQYAFEMTNGEFKKDLLDEIEKRTVRDEGKVLKDLEKRFKLFPLDIFDKWITEATETLDSPLDLTDELDRDDYYSALDTLQDARIKAIRNSYYGKLLNNKKIVDVSEKAYNEVQRILEERGFDNLIYDEQDRAEKIKEIEDEYEKKYKGKGLVGGKLKKYKGKGLVGGICGGEFVDDVDYHDKYSSFMGGYGTKEGAANNPWLSYYKRWLSSRNLTSNKENMKQAAADRRDNKPAEQLALVKYEEPAPVAKKERIKGLTQYERSLRRRKLKGRPMEKPELELLARRGYGAVGGYGSLGGARKNKWITYYKQWLIDNNKSSSKANMQQAAADYRARNL